MQIPRRILALVFLVFLAACTTTTEATPTPVTSPDIGATVQAALQTALSLPPPGQATSTPVVIEREVTREVPVTRVVEVTREVPVTRVVEVTRIVTETIKVEVTRVVVISQPTPTRAPTTLPGPTSPPATDLASQGLGLPGIPPVA